MHKYHLVLSDGNERDVTAAGVQFVGPILSFYNEQGEPTLAYSEGEWKYVELERLDDKE